MRLLARVSLTLLLTYCCRPADAAFNGTRCCAAGTKLVLGRCQDGYPALAGCAGQILEKSVIGRDVRLTVGQDGELRVEPGSVVYQPHEYCRGEGTDEFTGTDEPVLLICLHDPENETYRMSGIFLLVSVSFALLTTAVYALLPELRDLHGKCVMCMCASMAVGFTNLASAQLSHGQDGIICHTYGFMIYFWMMAMFFWMNVICIHMWVTAAGVYFYSRKPNNYTDGQQFTYYSFYAWGMTFAFLAVALLTNYTEGHLSPGIGQRSCWFKGDLEIWIYFYGPIGILLTVNVGLFIATSGLLWQNTASQHISNLALLKYRFTLYLKLFLLTGMFWICEVASFAHGENTVFWTITDTINCLQGLIIFLVLVVFRKRAIRGLASAGYLPCLKDLILRWFPSENDAECQEIVPQDDLEQPTSNHNLEDATQQP